MKASIISLCAMMIVVPAYAILGLEYGLPLNKFYGPYYMGLKKGLEAEKGLEMAHAYDPKFFPYGKGFPYYNPLLVKEKELGFGIGKAMYNPIFAKEKTIGAEVGKEHGKFY